MENFDQQAFGFWPSQIPAAMVAKASKRIREVACLENAHNQQAVVWVEARPELEGRCVIMITGYDGQPRELLNLPGFSVRSLINSYGGGALLFREDAIYFVNHNPLVAFNDQRIYRLQLDKNLAIISAPQPITTETDCCYGDLHYDARRKRIICVREKALADGSSRQDIVCIELPNSDEPGDQTILVTGFDFFSSPTLSPCRNYLSYIGRNQPNMPWDNSELRLLKLDDNGEDWKDIRISSASDDALCEGESVQQARWHRDGYLYFISDRSNFWHLYRYDLIADSSAVIIADILESQHPLHEAEFASPAWELGQSSYDFVDDNTLVALCNKAGRWQIQSFDLSKENVSASELQLYLPEAIKKQPQQMPEQEHQWQTSPADFFAHLHASSTSLICIAASATSAAKLVRFELATEFVQVISQTDEALPLSANTISQPEMIRFPVSGAETSNVMDYAHAFFYAPVNDCLRGSANGAPPLIIKTHGGPTSATSTQLDWSIQFFTSRGFAVVDINYRGSTGYGRDYRHALYGQWGVADLQDCGACIDYLAAENKIDAQRVFARGQSAGGYLTLMLASFTDRLCAGASTAGISDLSLLYQQTHKFEKEYLFNLLACRPDNDERGIYRRRSPLHAPELKTPLLFIQGSEDKVVPAQQTNKMLARLKDEGVRAQCLLFEDEQHGLRQSNNIEKALNAELAFFRSFL